MNRKPKNGLKYYKQCSYDLLANRQGYYKLQSRELTMLAVTHITALATKHFQYQTHTTQMLNHYITIDSDPSTNRDMHAVSFDTEPHKKISTFILLPAESAACFILKNY